MHIAHDPAAKRLFFGGFPSKVSRIHVPFSVGRYSWHKFMEMFHNIFSIVYIYFFLSLQKTFAMLDMFITGIVNEVFFFFSLTFPSCCYILVGHYQ